MLGIFKKKIKEDEVKLKKKHGFEISLIGSVLAYEVARADGVISKDELINLLHEVEKVSMQVNKKPEEILNLIEAYSSESISFYDFISDINNDFSKEDKLELIKYLWNVAYVDKVIDVNEERLIRRIADLIKIKDIEVLKLKSKAKKI